MSRILPLDQEAIFQICSSKQITTLQGVLLALVQNSLDADATRVYIAVDFRRGDCTIEDDGVGITPSDFRPGGGLGKLYHTSKGGDRNSGELHGSSGTYLASLAALSLLSITSRHRDHPEHATLTMHNGRVISRLMPAPSTNDLSISRTHGTQIVVRNLFGNIPVRVKQRMLSEESSLEHSKAWRELKRGIVALLLAWPKPCLLRLSNSDMPNRALSLSSHHPSVPAALTEKSLNKLHGIQHRSDIRDVLPILFQSGLAASVTKHQWVPVSAAASFVSIKGIICLTAAPAKQCQFISIDIAPCSSDSGHNELYDLVNQLFANSDFGVTDDARPGANVVHSEREPEHRSRGDGFTQRQLQGKKGIDRWPMFVLRLSLRNGFRQAAVTTEGDLKAMTDVLEATITQWLATNHFRPHKRRIRRNEAQSSPAVTLHFSGLDRSVPAPKATNSTKKRPATVNGQFSIKKRRTSFETNKPGMRNKSDLENSSRDISWLSNIKLGHDHPSASHSVHRPETAPALLNNGVQSPGTVASNEFVNVSQFESGGLHIRPSTPALTLQSRLRPKHVNHQARDEVPSSDSFGSADEMAMCEVAKALEEGTPATDDGGARSHGLTVPPRDPAEDTVITWTDPVTKQAFNVNARTGVVLPVRSRALSNLTGAAEAATGCDRPCAAINTAVTSLGQPIGLSRRSRCLTTPVKDATWLPGFLKDWDNPVFSRQSEKGIPVAWRAEPEVDVADCSKDRVAEQNFAQCFSGIRSMTTSKLSKAALCHASIIRQVDAKFILCKMPVDNDQGIRDVLVLVDQHAASERVILERLLRQLCSPPEAGAAVPKHTHGDDLAPRVRMSVLERSLRFEVSSQEHRMFHQHREHFARWGIVYDLSETTNTPSASQVRPLPVEHVVSVRALPPVIAERCSLFPKLLIELLRSEIWTLVDTSTRPRPKTPIETIPMKERSDQHSWLKYLGSCPKGIFDMLNSRACRSAIMFNDVLTMQECRTLLAELATCAFPFTCAHGRVSMVPLVELQRDSDQGLSELMAGGAQRKTSTEDVGGFVAAFRRWRCGWGVE